jgi:hypothetical protein
MGAAFGLVRIAIVMAMTALGGAVVGYGLAQKYYYTGEEKKEDEKTR